MSGVSAIYIVEDSRSYEYKAFARTLRVEPISIRDLEASHLQGDPNLIIDVDLRSTANMRRLTQLLQRRGTGCRIFLIDPRSWSATEGARMLGADRLLPLRCDPKLVRDTLREHFHFSDDPVTTLSIEAGMMALDGGFRSLLRDEMFDTAGMENASNQIIDAIDSAGVDQWMATVRGYHVGTFQHCMLVTATASSFARKLGMRRGDVVKITAAALVHDIGKSAIPLEILDKNGPLTPDELKKMQEHPGIGHSYLAKKSRIAADALSSVRSHHEFLDGSGYPDGLSGHQIDDITRIITISDIYAAMVERAHTSPPDHLKRRWHCLVSLGEPASSKWRSCVNSPVLRWLSERPLKTSLALFNTLF